MKYLNKKKYKIYKPWKPFNFHKTCESVYPGDQKKKKPLKSWKFDEKSVAWSALSFNFLINKINNTKFNRIFIFCRFFFVFNLINRNEIAQVTIIINITHALLQLKNMFYILFYSSFLFFYFRIYYGITNFKNRFLLACVYQFHNKLWQLINFTHSNYCFHI